MAIVTRRGEHRLADPNAARGAGRDSLHSPMRGLLDYQGALDDTIGQAGGKIGGKIEDVVAFIKATTGIDLSGPAELLTLPLDALGGTQLGQAFEALGMFLPFLSGVDPATMDTDAAAADFITTRLDPTGLLLSLTGPIPAANLFGQLPVSVASILPISALADYAANLLTNPTFDTADAFDDPSFFDPTISHTATGGSGVLFGDGTLQEFVSDPATRVAPGVDFDISQWVNWSGVSAVGDAFLLSIDGFASTDGTGVPIVSAVLDTITDPASDSINPAEDDFVNLAGSWLVPAGVNSVRTRLTQTPNVLTGQSNWDDGLLSPTQLLKQDWVEGLLGRLTNINPLTGLLDAAGLTNVGSMPTLPQSVVANLPTLAGDVTSGFQNIFNEWFNTSTATGTPVEVATAVAAIRASVAGGFTLQTFTASNASWSVPPELASAAEAYAGVIGGGGKGAAGAGVSNNTAGIVAAGGAGGTSGGYKVEKFDPATLGATLAVTVGAAASANGANGGATSIVNGATTLAASTTGSSGIAAPQGYQPSTSMPGAGGRGGSATTGTSGTGLAAAGVIGDSSATAAGGAGGTASESGGAGTGGAGSSGSAGQTATVPIAGGGGGGGGGGRTSMSTGNATGGVGGAGGFPGSGSGGGGAAAAVGISSSNGGNGGTPGNGLGFLLWR